ncbi:unnamed protein product [Rotaria sp. Silwood2]|nr:unnamed protein product [Rotaria sp. Silwood2]CAF4369172.1 unnamed protein product [Rotaria sp. Silwood2]
MIVLSRTNHAEELNSKLFIAKALSRLDSFMNDKKFMDIYKEYQNILFTNTSDVCKKAIDAITTNNYDLVASEMAALQSSDKIDSITVVRTLLGIYCTPEVSKLIDELKTSLNNVVLIDIVKKYSEMDINKYTLNPPADIFAKFGEVSNVKPIYHQAYNKIKEAILTKLRQELDDAKTKQPLSCDNIYIRNFESAIKYLPKEMKESLEIELKHCKEDIARLIQDHNNKVVDVFNNGDFKTMNTLLEEYHKFQEMRPYFNKGRDLVLKSIRDIVAKIRESFEKSDIADALSNVKTLHEYRIKFQALFADVGQLCFEVTNQIKMVFSEAHHGFVSSFLDNNVQNVTDDIVRKDSSAWSNWAVPGIRNYASELMKCNVQDSIFNIFSTSNRQAEQQNSGEPATVKEVEKNFLCLIEFIKFSNENRDELKDNDVDQSRLIDIFPEDFDEKLKTLNEQLVKFFAKREEQYKNALQILDITSLEEVLNMSKQWDFLIEKIIKHKSIYHIIDASENNIGKTITKVTLFPQIIDSINDKLQKLKDELIHQELINEETKGYSKHRDEFYRQLNKKFTILHNAKVFSSYGIRIDINSAEKECSKSLELKIKAIYSSVEEFIKKFVQDTELSKSEYDSFNLHYNNMLSFKKEMEFAATDNNIKVDEIDNPKAFQDYSLSLFNEKTQKHGIDYVLANITGDISEKTRLKRRYDEFCRKYDELVKRYLKPSISLDQLIANTKLLVEDVKQQSDQIEWDTSIRNKIPELAAHIFALWTLQNACHYFEDDGVENRNSYLLQPHAAQIISIFRMLGIDDTKEQLSYNLIQIETGEGKSVTLGATASILALFGFDVCCACYSEYLSQRDYKSFLSLFNSLDVSSHIHYGTFNKLYEHRVNENSDICQVVEQLILTDSNIAVENANIIKRSKILLIDEVDVFFSRHFYGIVYTPAVSLKEPTIISLVNYSAGQKSRTPLNFTHNKS